MSVTNLVPVVAIEDAQAARGRSLLNVPHDDVSVKKAGRC